MERKLKERLGKYRKGEKKREEARRLQVRLHSFNKFPVLR